MNLENGGGSAAMKRKYDLQPTDPVRMLALSIIKQAIDIHNGNLSGVGCAYDKRIARKVSKLFLFSKEKSWTESRIFWLDAAEIRPLDFENKVIKPLKDRR